MTILRNGTSNEEDYTSSRWVHKDINQHTSEDL